MDSYTEWNRHLINDRYEWIIPARYIDLTPLGQGSFGLVCSAFDTLKSRNIAIKKLSRPFETNVHAKRAFREVKLLKHVNHDNIILLLDIFTKCTADNDFEDVYLCTNLMSTNLKAVLKEQKLKENQIRFFTYQILRGLKYLHSASITHRDLKPENITVNENLELRLTFTSPSKLLIRINKFKIIDFGLARSEKEKMTGYVATRYYRAPEIMLKWMRYSKAVDIWSVACIIYEMYSQKVLFEGNDNIYQLNLILQITGYPNADLMEQINQDARIYLENKEIKPIRVNFYNYFQHVIDSKDAIDLIDKMLELDQNKRITAEKALEHDYLERFHDPNDEPSSEPFDYQYEFEDLDLKEWKERILAEIKSYNPPNE